MLDAVCVFAGITSSVVIATVSYVSHASKLYEGGRLLNVVKGLFITGILGFWLLPACLITKWGILQTDERVFAVIVLILALVLAVLL